MYSGKITSSESLLSGKVKYVYNSGDTGISGPKPGFLVKSIASQRLIKKEYFKWRKSLDNFAVAILDSRIVERI